MKQILIKLKACQEAIEWVADKTIEQAVNDCTRGDWMLWLANKVNVDFQKLTLAKGLCANTVRHLIKSRMSILAVDTAIRFGEGKATLYELQHAAAAAYDAAGAAGAFADCAAFLAADAATSAASDAYLATSTASAAADVFYNAADWNIYAAARKENQLKTANICREVFGQELIDKLEQL